MSLNWNFTNCPAWKKTGKKVADCDDESHSKPCKVCKSMEEWAMHLPDGTPIPWGITNALIWATMAVGLGWDIKKDIEEFVFRIAYYQRVFGALCRGGGKDRVVTPEEVRAHAGMYVNVATKTRRQFMLGLAEVVEREIEEQVALPKEAEKA